MERIPPMATTSFENETNVSDGGILSLCWNLSNPSSPSTFVQERQEAFMPEEPLYHCFEVLMSPNHRNSNRRPLQNLISQRHRQPILLLRRSKQKDSPSHKILSRSLRESKYRLCQRFLGLSHRSVHLLRRGGPPVDVSHENLTNTKLRVTSFLKGSGVSLH